MNADRARDMPETPSARRGTRPRCYPRAARRGHDEQDGRLRDRARGPGAGAGRLGLQRLQRPGGRRAAGGGAVGERRERLSAPRRPGPQPGRHGEGRRQFRAGDAQSGGRGAQPRRPGHGRSRSARRPAALRPVPAGAGPALFGAVAPAGGGGALSRAQSGRQLHRPAAPARGDREPHQRRAQPFQRGGAGLQHDGRSACPPPGSCACSAGTSRTSPISPPSPAPRPRRACSSRGGHRGATPLPFLTLRPPAAHGEARNWRAPCAGSPTGTEAAAPSFPAGAGVRPARRANATESPVVGPRERTS